MRIKNILRFFLPVICFLTFSCLLTAQASGSDFEKMEQERTDLYAGQLEDYLRMYLVDRYGERSGCLWNRDYSCEEAFVRSVEPNRERWKSLVIKPPVLKKTGSVNRLPYTVEGIEGEWLELPLGPLTAQAFLAFPPGTDKNKPVPLVIAQHGIGSTPESPYKGGGYNYYAKELLKAGFAVLAPMNLRSVERRNRIERLCRLADISLPGIELARVQHLLDVVLEDARIDSERIGMWGLSLGGMATMFWMPLEPRIKAGIVSAWFNHRRNKMAVPDERYVSFLVTAEEHAFFTGWLTEFSDHDVVSLICPRPLMIQHGKTDRIAWWPQVIEEFNVAKAHYEKLNIPERMEIDVHEGGHDAVIISGIRFMTRYLNPDPAPVPVR
ncbi:MAG TPA: alpha/beta hydrolase family protein [Bacteroidales bacterium]|jgi:dienelactone hydrolase|nr:alpha/beta hydrolase family protein [Bacteroidales bacterium]HQH23504.1 alpha/beta hydrolase family protein [Bacteroidales bacterium]HQJ83254.1 alpha/beta hydrolase family protein [Bacteroidales bacterium]